MTELQFLIDLLLNHKLNANTKKLVADRIGFVEESLRKPAVMVPRGTPMGVQQSASTQALLDKEPLIVQQPLPMTSAPTSARIIGGEVATGGGARGPRKF